MGAAKLTDNELLELLYSSGDTLTVEQAADVVSRGGRMVKPLDEIVSDRLSWTEELPAWWSVVHATYLLGRIGGDRVIPSLLRSLRYADAFYNDWILDMLPSIFGSLGTEAKRPLEIIALERGEHFLVRTVALEGLAAATLRDASITEEAFLLVEKVFSDLAEPRLVRQGAALVLMDFKRKSMKKELAAFAREESAVLDYDQDYPAVMLPDDVKQAFSNPEPVTEFYTMDWMRFYDAAEIAKRQERWAREASRQARVELPAADSLAAKALLRDGPCPCGSGRKFRSCCMNKVH
jgi:hypothetical protein